MLLDIVFMIAGFAVLYFGAEFFVRGSANTAVMLGINPIVVGLTVVAFGTSAPELLVSLLAALRDAPGLAMGNVVGSNIANIGLVMAIGAVLAPLAMQRVILVRDLPIMLLFSVALVGLGFDGELSRLDGAVLFAGLAAYVAYHLVAAMKTEQEAASAEEMVSEVLDEGKKIWFELAMTALGLAGVVGGAHLLVESASSIARAMGVSDLVIGVTVVAIGTSVPELATTVVAAVRKHSDIAVGNIIGSNIFNIGSVLGLTALTKPIHSSWEAVGGDMIIMLVFGAALVLPAYRLVMGRVAGAALLAGYVAFIGWTVHEALTAPLS